ncbi:hypothetical protein ACFHWD_20435 [Clostridium sp. MT-14]|jgi:hypothetical protein|uniref:Uncharacterized protein n=1 Tax=Clostridium aromativorans TaxID=2836848 RepID=A0ABS8NAD9_9CLOT|nr:MULTISPECIES: hypothetical protein [Clostridium]KAA8667709.1 hypothetical protein F3O63_15515 [Clostridium sp. HV4-5-A1G]MCC9296783.1 hypothetical protein [Clostridium aromativorans]CAB1249293.1 conserved hypothetical protein [Clostridiaceae bacterium BL-3]
MEYREDYYKFSHVIFPISLFKYRKQFIQKIKKEGDSFSTILKKGWNSIVIEKGIRNAPPSFKINLLNNIKNSYSLIVIEIPEARESTETPYIGIVFDKDYNIRYFTYEIEKEFGKKCYFLCEWSQDRTHINYGEHMDKNLNTFTQSITDLI